MLSFKDNGFIFIQGSLDLLFLSLADQIDEHQQNQILSNLSILRFKTILVTLILS